MPDTQQTVRVKKRRVITVRVLEREHAELIERAHTHRTTLNKMCRRALSLPDLIPPEPENHGHDNDRQQTAG